MNTVPSPTMVSIILLLTLLLFSIILTVSPSSDAESCAVTNNHNNGECIGTTNDNSRNPSHTDTSVVDDTEQCKLYMAESTIPNAGWGIYTAVPLRNQDVVSYPELIVNNFDMAYQKRLHREYTLRQKLRQEATAAAALAAEMNEGASGSGGGGGGEEEDGEMTDEWDRHEKPFFPPETYQTTRPTDKHKKCHSWSRDGECDANPNYMLINCERSCQTQNARNTDHAASSSSIYDTVHDTDDTPFFWLPHNYYWNTGCTHSVHEADHPESLIVGMGALANSHPGLVNLAMNRPIIDDVDRETNPLTGSYSNFHGVEFRAVVEVEAGSELYAPYGDSWFFDHESVIGKVPVSYTYEIADDVMKRFVKFVDGNYADDGNSRGGDDDGAAAGIPTTDTSSSVSFSSYGTITEEQLYSFLYNDLITDERLRAALPPNSTDVKHAIYSSYSSTSTSSSSSIPEGGISVRYHHNHIRPLSWLHTHGSCLDNIRPGPSTIFSSQAGRGAFATRHLPQGSIVSPAPMMQIKRDDLYWYEESEDSYYHWDIYRRGKQLILNYCFGHKDSSLLLFPYSPMVNYINHGGKDGGSNVKLRWVGKVSDNNDNGQQQQGDPSFLSTSDLWRTQSPDRVLSYQTAGLNMEFVAIRDISEGEEILIDYGDRWENAWRKYLEDWEPVDGANRYKSAAALNAEMDDVWTVDEVLKNKVEPWENYYYDKDDGDDGNQEEDGSMYDNIFTVCYLPYDVRKYAGGTSSIFDGEGKVQWYMGVDLFRRIDGSLKCSILERYHGEKSRNDKTGEEEEVEIRTLYRASVVIKDVKFEVYDIPRNAIEFVDHPYTSDQHILDDHTFRHEMDLGEDLFPDEWKDLA